MGWDDQVVTEDVDRLVRKSILGGVMPDCPGIVAALPPILIPVPGLEPRLSSVLRYVLEFALSDIDNRYLRAAKSCLGIKTEHMPYDQLWEIVELSSELEEGKTNRLGKGTKRISGASEEYMRNAREKLAQNSVIRCMLAMRELGEFPGSRSGFEAHRKRTIEALKDSIHAVLSDDDKVQEIANLCKLPSDGEQKGVRHEPDAHAAIDGRDPVDEERLELLAFEQAPIVPPNPVRQQRTVILGDHPRKPNDFVESSKAGQLRELGSGAGLIVVRGQRGAGKTQLAAYYWRACRAAGWELLAWVNAEDSDVLLSGFNLVMEGLGVEDRSQDLQASARTLRDILERRDEPALLVLDNAIDVDLVKSAVPECGATRILVTTTNAAFERLGPYLRVDGFTEPEAIAYLHQRTGRTDDEGARAVAEELGFLPLALAQAGAMLREHPRTYGEYLIRLRAVPVMDLLDRSEGDDYPRGTAAAILLSVESVESGDISELGGRVLRLVALLGSPSVRRDFLYAALAAPDERSRLVVDTAIARCVRASLLDWSEDSTSLVMHRLVARVLRERAQVDGSLADTVESALRLIDLCKVPIEEAWNKRTVGEELARYVETLTRHIPDWSGLDIALRLRAGEVQKWAADQLRKTSNPLRAVEVGHLGLENLRAAVGDNDPRVWDCCQTVGWSYLKAHRSSEGLPLVVQGVDLMSGNLGPTAPATLNARKDLAVSYRNAGNSDEAARRLRELLREMSDAGQQDDPIAISAGSNLAYILMLTKKHKESIAAYREVLDARTRVFGPNHPDTRKSRSNLASAYHAAGKNKEAVKLFSDLLRGNEQTLSPADHPDIVLARENLGHVYVTAGDEESAIELFKIALRDRERGLNPSHPQLIACRIALAQAYESIGSFDRAIEQWQLVVSAREDSLGSDSNDTHWAAERLAAAQAERDRG